MLYSHVSWELCNTNDVVSLIITFLLEYLQTRWLTLGVAVAAVRMCRWPQNVSCGMESPTFYFSKEFIRNSCLLNILFMLQWKIKLCCFFSSWHSFWFKIQRSSSVNGTCLSALTGGTNECTATKLASHFYMNAQGKQRTIVSVTGCGCRWNLKPLRYCHYCKCNCKNKNMSTIKIIMVRFLTRKTAELQVATR